MYVIFQGKCSTHTSEGWKSIARQEPATFAIKFSWLNITPFQTKNTRKKYYIVKVFGIKVIYAVSIQPEEHEKYIKLQKLETNSPLVFLWFHLCSIWLQCLQALEGKMDVSYYDPKR